MFLDDAFNGFSLSLSLFGNEQAEQCPALRSGQLYPHAEHRRGTKPPQYENV
jgi:hypothetical protein